MYMTGVTTAELQKVKQQYRGRCIKQVWKEKDGKIHVVLGRKCPSITYFKFPKPHNDTTTVNEGL